MKKKKLHRNIIICLLMGVTVLPASVYASTQPMDWDAVYEEVLSESGSEDDLLKVPGIALKTEEIWRSINAGDTEGAIYGFFGLLGELGLVDPADISARLGEGTGEPGDSEENPYSNPKTPAQVYDLQRYTDLVRSEMSQKMSQTIFGTKGQQIRSEQAQALQQAQSASLSAQQKTSEVSKQSSEQAAQNAESASKVSAESRKAQSAKASQDVLKAIAAQNAELGNIGAGSSEQMAQLAGSASYQSAQLSAVNAGLSALNDKTQSLEALSASQNYQLSQVDASLDHQIHYQQQKDSAQQSLVHRSSTIVYIPGLVKEAEE
jgi:hypothetical protein